MSSFRGCKEEKNSNKPDFNAFSKPNGFYLFYSILSNTFSNTSGYSVYQWLVSNKLATGCILQHKCRSQSCHCVFYDVKKTSQYFNFITLTLAIVGLESKSLSRPEGREEFTRQG